MLVFMWIPLLLIAFALVTGQSFGLKRSMFGSYYGVVDRDDSPVDFWVNVGIYVFVLGAILYTEFFG